METNFKTQIKSTYLYIVLLTTVLGFGQSLPSPSNIQSPNAASLGKYGDVPVSLYTGAPVVSIPLYSMEEMGVKLDLSLNYDASGVRVASLPSWVGQNWSLDAGGVITRSIQGKPDELYLQSSPAGSARGYFYSESHDRLNVSNWLDLSFLVSIHTSNFGVGSPPVSKDSQPDIFTFNFMGYAGKFFMGEDGQWKVASDSNLKIVITESFFTYPLNEQFIGSNPQHKTIAKIEITDDKGITYTFGSDNVTTNAAATEYSKEFYFQKNLPWNANAWYLTTVKNHLNKVLYSFTYERDGFNAQFYQYNKSTLYNAQYDNNNGQWNGIDGCQFTVGGSFSVSGMLESPVYLKTITSLTGKQLNFNRASCNNLFYSKTTGPLNTELTNFANNTIIPNQFLPEWGSFSLFFKYLHDYSPGYSDVPSLIGQLQWRRLTDITESSSSSTIVSFQTNHVNYPNEHAERFNLKGVTVDGKVYSFEYDRFDQLPIFLSKAFDHMGYYDGADYDNPTQANFSGHYAQRETNSDKVKIGSLKKITYPTKGYTEFTYEPHAYSKYVNDTKTGLTTVANAIIGGLRVQQIATNDGRGNTETKTYRYIKDYALNPSGTVSSGILSNLPKYYWADWRVASAPGSYSGYLSETIFSINPIVPLGNFFGSPIGYSEVTEVTSGLGYTVYKYTSNEDIVSGIYPYMDEAYSATFNLDPSPYGISNDKSLLRGKLKEKVIYDNGNNWVQKTITSYSVNDPSLTKFVKGTNAYGFSCAGDGHGFMEGNAYKLYYFDNRPIKEENYSKFGANEVKVTSNYAHQYYPDLATSNGDIFLQSQDQQTYLQNTDTGNEKIEKFFTYPFEISSTVNDALIGKRLFPVLIEENKNNGELVSKVQTDYYNFPSNFLMPSKTMEGKGDNVGGIIALEDVLVIDVYDSNGNIAQYHSPGGKYITVFWAYKKRYPIAMLEGPITSLTSGIAPLKVSEIESLLNASSGAWSSSHQAILDKLQEVRDAYPNHMVTTYTYVPFGDNIKSMTDPKGYASFYEYDQYKRLSYIRDAENNIIKRLQYNYKP